MKRSKFPIVCALIASFATGVLAGRLWAIQGSAFAGWFQCTAARGEYLHLQKQIEALLPQFENYKREHGNYPARFEDVLQKNKLPLTLQNADFNYYPSDALYPFQGDDRFCIELYHTIGLKSLFNELWRYCSDTKNWQYFGQFK